jgi:hypothetical protein
VAPPGSGPGGSLPPPLLPVLPEAAGRVTATLRKIFSKIFDFSVANAVLVRLYK